MALTERTQILMTPDEIRRLRRIARLRKTSVGRLVRDAVREKYLVEDTEARARAVEEIAAMDLFGGGAPLPGPAELAEELDARFDGLLPGREHRALRGRRRPPAP